MGTNYNKDVAKKLADLKNYARTGVKIAALGGKGDDVVAGGTTRRARTKKKLVSMPVFLNEPTNIIMKPAEFMFFN